MNRPDNGRSYANLQYNQHGGNPQMHQQQQQHHMQMQQQQHHMQMQQQQHHMHMQQQQQMHHHHQQQQQHGGFIPPNEQEDEEEIAEAQLTLDLLKSIEQVRPEIFEGEQRRETIELNYQSIRDVYYRELESKSKRRPQQETYLKLLQSLYCRNLNVARLQNRRLNITYDMIMALEKRRELADLIDNETNKLKLLASSTTSKSSKKSKDALAAANKNKNNTDSTAMLKISISNNNSDDIIFYHGQSIITPLGEGIINNIHPHSKKLTIK